MIPCRLNKNKKEKNKDLDVDCFGEGLKIGTIACPTLNFPKISALNSLRLKQFSP